MKKHPVFWGMLLLIALAFVLYVFFYGVGASTGKTKSFSLNDKVGVVSINGVIIDSREIIEQLEEFGKNDSIVAVVLRIDSPGEELLHLRKFMMRLLN